MNLSIKSIIVIQRDVKEGNVARGAKCCKKTFPNKVDARVRVSSMAVFSPGWLGRSKWVNIGNKTLVKEASHSSADTNI